MGQDECVLSPFLPLARTNLCDQLLKSGQTNTQASAVTKKPASCNTPLSHALPGLIGYICIMYMHDIKQVMCNASVKRHTKYMENQVYGLDTEQIDGIHNIWIEKAVDRQIDKCKNRTIDVNPVMHHRLHCLFKSIAHILARSV